VAELQAGLGDGRVVYDLKEAGWVRRQGAVEKRLVQIQKIYQVNEPVQVGGLAL